MAKTYSIDIFPKFRAVDISCMTAKGVKLGNSTWMRDPSASDDFADHANARLVYSVLAQGIMPPGQAWLAEWLEHYRGWMEDGFQP
jgi:hypothetical protein